MDLLRFPNSKAEAKTSREKSTRGLVFGLIALAVFLFAVPALAQSGLEGRISQTIYALVRVINVLIAGFVVWAGFLIAKGDSHGFQRLIYGVIGLVVTNAAYLIVNYFS